MNRKITTIAALGMAAVFLVALLPTGASQEEAEFGTQVQPGDADFIPVLDRVWTLGTNVCYIDFGETNVQEFGFYLRPDAATGTTANLERFSVRLVEAQGNAAGSLVLNSHTAEQNRACTSSGTVDVVYGDLNNNGRYDEGDYVWLTTGTGGNLDASSSGTSFTIRLTQTNGGAAGTLVFAQDADYTSYNGNANSGLQPAFGFHNADRSGGSGASATFTTGDQMYLALAETGITAPGNGDLVPLHSLRLHGDAGGFGSQVGEGDSDFVPLVNEISTAGFGEICVVEFGDGNNVNEFGFYMDPHGTIAPGDSVDSGFIRLKGADAESGSRVRGTDTTEVGRECYDDVGGAGLGVPTFGVHYADRNNNGRYDEGDWVFMSSNAGSGNLAASSSAESWTLRLTETESGAAGSLAFAGDSDFQSWSQNTGEFPDDGANWGVFDRDRSGVANANNVVTEGDSVYLLAAEAGDLNAPDLVPVYSIRILGDAGAFGSQIQFGDEDFIPTLDDSLVPSVCVVELGDGQSVEQFGFYLVFGGASTVPTNAVRLKSVEGNPAGSTVRDAHTTERGQTCAQDLGIGGAGAVSVHYTDLNNNARYDANDAVYLTTSTTGGLDASQDSTTWTLRLTEASGSAPGTLVFSGDQDFQARGSTSTDLADADVAFFDADLSGSFNRDDAVYVTPTPLTGEELVPLYSIRVTGQLPAGGGATGPGASPTPTDDATTSPTPDETPDETPDTTPDETPDTTPDETPDTTPDTTPGTTPDDDDEEPTPGFGLVAILAAFGLLAVALRRRS